jgi:hypothetical protein
MESLPAVESVRLLFQFCYIDAYQEPTALDAGLEDAIDKVVGSIPR